MLSRLGRVIVQKQRLVPQMAARTFVSSKADFGGHSAHDGHDDHGHGDHGHGHSDEPHVPEFYDKLGKGCLIAAYLWIFYRFKQDKGQLFGIYKPWLDEHHHEHIEYQFEGTGDYPAIVQHESHEDDEDEE